MSEMLGNRYFLARKFDKAIPELEKALSGTAQDAKIKKKLVICYVQIGQIEKALEFFEELITEDPYIILNTDPYYDDCPCPTLVEQWEKLLEYKDDTIRMEYVALGILYLYCDILKSIPYFQKAEENVEDAARIGRILRRLRATVVDVNQSS